MQKELKNLIKAGEPFVVVVLSFKGLEKSFVFYEEENAEALEAGNLLLARISYQLALLDNAVRYGSGAADGSPGESAEAVEQVEQEHAPQQK
jgi:hypothetical protein